MQTTSAVRRRSDRKQLGAFYTPQLLATAMANWAVRDPGDHVLDGAFGGLAFLSAAAHRLGALGATHEVSGQLHGCDIDAGAHRAALARTDVITEASSLVHDDFLERQPDARLPRCQAVVGNPPYIRFQSADREAGQRAAQAAGLSISRLASVWAPFLAHSVHFVAAGGRLAYVLPGELLHAQYAAEVLDFVCERFGAVTLVLLEQRVFADALEEVVLLLADDKGGTCDEPTVVSFAGLDELSEGGLPVSVPRATRGRRAGQRRTGHDKPLAHLLPTSTRELMSRLLLDPRVQLLGRFASVKSGAVTGANRFFLLSDEQARADGIDDTLLRDAVSKAAHVAGSCLREEDVRALRSAGAPLRLLLIPRDATESQLQSVAEILARGVGLRVQEAFKCRTRSPWWSVPLPAGGPPDLLLTYFAAEHHRLAVNDAGVLHTNTVHGVRVLPGVTPEALARTWFNSLSSLSRELVGRSYGGGVLKLEPTEAEAVVLPPLAVEPDLLNTVDERVRAGDASSATDEVDRCVLGGGLGLTNAEIAQLRHGAELLRARRRERGGPIAAVRPEA